MDLIAKVLQWVANVCKVILTVVINYPSLWICTYIIRRRIKKTKAFVTLNGTDVMTIINAAIKPGNGCHTELTDRSYNLPKKEWIEYINNNLWIPYREIRQFVYGENYDCDNYAVSFFNLVQELMLGLCIGIAHYGYTVNGEYKAHAVACFIPEDLKNFWLLEPQYDTCATWALDKDKQDLYFVYLEGVK